MPQKVQELIADFDTLIKEWEPRNEEFRDSYKLLSLYDELEDRGASQEDKLESFVSNDPRVMHNMAMFLLTPNPIPYNIPAEGQPETIQGIITNIEKAIRQQWDILDEKSLRTSNGGTWLWTFNNVMLSTGWYSVFAVAQGNEFIADIWNPAQVYPEFDLDGLSRVLNYYTLSASRIRQKIKASGWDIQYDSSAPAKVYNYWDYDKSGDPHNIVIIGNEVALDKSWPKLYEIPVYCSGVNGLPDRGVLTLDDVELQDWHATVGQSLNATNRSVMRAHNRQRSFMQQIIRDTAQPRIVEKTKGGKQHVNSKNWNKRGAIYNLDVDEDIGAVPMPGMPPELSISLQDMQGMIQRGGFDYSIFQGGQASGYAQALVSASAQQVLLPFKTARDFVISCVSNLWLNCVKTGMAKFPDFDADFSLLPESLKFKSDIKVSIPGDLIQRATTARTLNPAFQISHAKTIELTMPEIVDPNGEVVATRVDRAMQNPMFTILDTIEAANQHADALSAEGQTRQADMYRAFAEQLTKQVQAYDPMQQMQQMQSSQPAGNPGQANAGQ